MSLICVFAWCLAGLGWEVGGFGAVSEWFGVVTWWFGVFWGGLGWFGVFPRTLRQALALLSLTTNIAQKLKKKKKLNPSTGSFEPV